MEFFIADAERMFSENGKVKHLSYWSYKIMTRCTLPSYQSPPLFPGITQTENYIVCSGHVDYCTWHRYSDFEWLMERLEDEFPGMVLPPLPEKATDGTVDKFADLMRSEKESEDANKNQPLVQQRIRRLQMALNVMSQMTELHESQLLRAFVSLDDAGWCIFREQAVKPQTTAWSSVKSTGFSLLSKLRIIKDNSEPVFPVCSPVDILAKNQQALSNLLAECLHQLEGVIKTSTAEFKSLSDLDETARKAQSRPLPSTLCFNGHLVRDAECDEVEGVVRHSDGVYAWVEWNSNKGKLSKVSIDGLRYPSSGVADPTVFVCQELTLQIESYIMYLHMRPETILLRDLIDLVWFLQKYAANIGVVVESLQKICREAQTLRKTIEKSKAKQEQLDHLKHLEDRFASGTARLVNGYKEVYLPFQTKSLVEVAKSYGRISSVLMNDEEWEQRLWRANAALPLLFDPPAEALESEKNASGTAGSSPRSDATRDTQHIFDAEDSRQVGQGMVTAILQPAAPSTEEEVHRPRASMGDDETAGGAPAQAFVSHITTEECHLLASVGVLTFEPQADNTTMHGTQHVDPTCFSEPPPLYE